MTQASIEKFKSLLHDLFQFDCVDLDFGIYRIMNPKRAVIEHFIAEDLPKAIAEKLQRGALAEQGQAQEALEAARQKVLDALGEDALNNLTFDDESGQRGLDLFKDDYLLHYMLRWETRHSATLLDVEKLQTPFAYKLRLHRDEVFANGDSLIPGAQSLDPMFKERMFVSVEV